MLTGNETMQGSHARLAGLILSLPSVFDEAW